MRTSNDNFIDKTLEKFETLRCRNYDDCITRFCFITIVQCAYLDSIINLKIRYFV